MITISNNEFEDLPDYPIPPGESLKEALEVIGMSQKELARRMGRPIKTINEIIHGKAAITAETALQLENVLGVTSKFWINLEANFQIIKAQAEASKKMAQEIKRIQKFPYVQMAKFGWVKQTRDIREKASELLRFFGVVSFSTLQLASGIRYRQAAKYKASPESLTAWLRKGELLSQKIQTNKYNKSTFLESLNTIKSMTRNIQNGFDIELQEICAACGVAVVFVPHLEKTYANGATRWITPDKALIQLSIRNRYQDIFWFTFFHEAAHILLHGKSDEFIDVDDQAKSAKELEADQWASSFLINEEAYNNFVVGTPLTHTNIIEFADRQNVSLDIVIGRLLHDSFLRYSKWNKYRLKLKWRSESID